MHQRNRFSSRSYARHAARSSIIAVGLLGSMGSTGQPSRVASPPAAAAGYVVDVSGEWIVSRQRQPLALGDSVLSGDTIRAGAGATTGQRISVVVRGTDALRGVCEPAAARGRAPRCRPLVVPSSSRTAAETFSRVMANAMALVRSHEERRYASLVSRGAGGTLSDAVVPVRDGVGDLAAAFAALDSGRYTVCLDVVSSADGAAPGRAECAVRVERQWSEGQPLRIEGVRPGLYEVRVGDGRRAWVLASDERTFAGRAAELARMKAAAQGWGARVPDAAKRRMVRAYLAALAADDARD